MIADKKKKIDRLIIDVSDSILSALKKMDELASKLLIVYKDGKFFSLISIGDIQRSILNKTEMSSSVEHILRPKSKLSVCTDADSKDAVRNKIIEHRIEFMPIVNDRMEMLDVIFWEEVLPTKDQIAFSEKLDVPVVIMAGGKGQRLYPITNIIPKPLVPIGDKAILEHIIDNFSAIGANKFYVSVNYKADMIANHFAQIKDKHYELNFFEEDHPLGTVGSLSLIKDKIDSTFFLTNCDILIDQDLVEVYKYHKENGNCLTIVGAVKHFTIPYGTIETSEDGRLSSLVEKPELSYTINTGVYILEPSLLKEIPENKFFHITDLIQKLINKNEKVCVFPISEAAWLDIGEWKEYLNTQERFQKRFGK